MRSDIERLLMYDLPLELRLEVGDEAVMSFRRGFSFRNASATMLQHSSNGVLVKTVMQDLLVHICIDEGEEEITINQVNTAKISCFQSPVSFKEPGILSSGSACHAEARVLEVAVHDT